MSGFRFRLEKVREQRQRTVDTRSQALAQASRQVARVEGMLARMEEEIRRQAASMARRRDRAENCGELQRENSWLSHLHRQAEDLGQMVLQAKEAESAARNELTAAWRDLEVLNRLREAQETQWRRNQDRRELRQMDEIGQRPKPAGISH